MESIILMFAEILPEEKIIEDFEEALREYKISGGGVDNKKQKGRLAFQCVLLLAKLKPGQEGKDVFDLMKEFEETKDWLKMKPKKQ